MSITKVSHSMISGAFLSPLDYGAVGDGVIDDSAAIQACVNAALTDQIIDFGGLVYVCNDVSVATNGLTLQNGKLIALVGVDSVSRLEIIGNDVFINNMHFYADSTLHPRIGQLDVNGANNVQITNCIFDGAHRNGPTQGGDHHVLILNSSKCLIQNNIFRGGEFTEQCFLVDSVYCIVDGNNFTGNSTVYSAIATFTPGGGSNESVISNNVCQDYRTSVITVNGDDCVIVGNIVRGSDEEQGINVGHSGIPAKRTVVADNRISDVVGSGIVLALSEDSVVSGNLIQNCNNPGIEVLASSNNCLISNNTIKDIVFISGVTNSAAQGIRIRGNSNFITIDGNYLQNIDDDGISLDSGKSYVIINNTWINIHNYAGGLPGGRFVIQWENPDASPEDLVVENNVLRSDAALVGPGPSRGVSVEPSNANLRASIMFNDFTPVTSTQLAFFEVTPPGFRRVQGNKASNDPMFTSVTIPGANTSLVVSNGNVRANSTHPKLTPRNVDATTRGIYVSAIADGSFTLTATAGSDALVYYEL